jgi:ABC-2 type transport system ATP-binding protein
LILDEPASGLDPRARTELRAILRELNAMGKTIIVSSHILPDVEEISDSICILEAGRRVLDGDLDSLRANSGATKRIVKLRVPREQLEVAADALRQLESVTSCEQRDDVLVIGSNEPNCNFILAELLAREIEVLAFAEDEPSLEEIFLRSTAGKVT